MRALISVLIVFLASQMFFPTDVGAQETSRPGVLTMGRATDDVMKYQKRYSPIIEYLASRLGDVGVKKGEVVLAGDNEASTLFHLIKQGALDMMVESAAATNAARQEAGVKPLVLLSFSGSPVYQAYLVVHKDGGIATLEDLKGKVVAFEDPDSTSGFWLPANELRVSGFDLVEVNSTAAAVPPGKIGYVFAGSEVNVSGWLFYRKVAAGALSSSDWDNPRNIPPAFKEQFRILSKSRLLPRVVLSVRGNMEAEMVRRIRDELLAMSDSEAGRNALSAYKGVDGFVLLTDEDWAALDGLDELIEK